MMDIANIYNLAPEELATYRETPFQDEEIRPGLKDFAQKLKEEIVKLPEACIKLSLGKSSLPSSSGNLKVSSEVFMT